MPAVPSNPESEKPLPFLFKRPVTLSRAMYSGRKKLLLEGSFTIYDLLRRQACTLVLAKAAVNGQQSHLLAWGAFCWCRTTSVGLLCAAGKIDIASLLSLSSVLPPSVI